MISSSRAKARVRQRQKLVNSVRFEHLLLGLNAEIEHGGQEVRKLNRIGLRHHRHPHFRRHIRQQGQCLLDHSLDVAVERLDRFVIDDLELRHDLDLRLQKRLVLDPFHDAKPVDALNDKLHDAFVAHHPLDVDDGADIVKVVVFCLVARHVIGLCRDAPEQLFFGRKRCLRRLHRTLAPDRQRDHRLGEKRRVLQRQHRNLKLL